MRRCTVVAGRSGHDPAFELGQVQRAGTGQDQADPVTQRIGGRQRGLRRLRRDLDAVGVDGRVLGGTGERGHQHPGHQRPDALLGTHEGQCDQADQHQRLRHQQPRAAAAEPTEQREGIAIQQGRPQELEQVEEAGQADQADAAQVQADVAQARGQGLRGDQQERQAAAEAEHGHGQRRRSAEGALDACPALVADRQALVAIDRAAAQAVTQARGDELVVDAPTDIVGAGGAAVAPPGVVLAGGVEQAVGIGPAAAGGDIGGLAVVGAQRVEPVALFRQAAGVLLVGLPVLDVQRRTDDVPVAAQHVVAAAARPFLEDRPQPFHHFELETLAQVARAAGRDIEGDHAEVAVARLDVAAFVVERGPAQRGDDLVRLALAVDRHAALALLGDGVAVEAVVAVRAEHRVGQLVFLGLGLLDAQDVGVLGPEPIEEALGCGGTDAIGVETDDAHAGDLRRETGQAYRLPAGLRSPPEGGATALTQGRTSAKRPAGLGFVLQMKMNRVLMSDHRHRFLQLALTADALRFGQFTLKSGRLSPYFFNAGRFDSGSLLSQLGACYADAIDATGIKYDVVFGPAYKGIPLATAMACELAQRGRDLPL
ncbi:hypothetical protein G6F59_012483 [Rhizopus arrhizus]|nr:hypothetical protein G6F59_012483 [Rhizopus arrhizus]